MRFRFYAWPAGCGGDNGAEFRNTVRAASFDDFVSEVQGSVAEDAANCGTVLSSEAQLDANTCVAEAFVDGRSFYAVYQLQGFDSSVGAAVTGDASGSVWHWIYDSNPSGGSLPAPSKIERSECSHPVLSGSVDGAYHEIFSGCTASASPPQNECLGYNSPTANVVVQDALSGNPLEGATVLISLTGEANSETMKAVYIEGDDGNSNSNSGAYFTRLRLNQLNYRVNITAVAQGYSEYSSEDIEFEVSTTCGAENSLLHTVSLCPVEALCR